MNIKKRQNKTGMIILLVVISLYILTAFADPISTLEALKSSFNVLKTILPILMVVLFLMTIIKSYIQPKKISEYLGGKSGFKGWLIAISGGIFTHGPSYAWYPMLSELREHGVKDGLIVAFFYARSIKIPWLPMMASYFGLAFTVVITFYILLAAILQGLITDKIMSSKT